MSIVPLQNLLANRPRRGMTNVDTVVLHASGMDDVDDFVRQLRKLDHSYHYIVQKDGTVLRAVPYSNVAFHTSNSYGPHEAEKGVPYDRDATGAFISHTCVNDYTIGLCFVNLNDDEDPYTQDQIAAASVLLRDLKAPLPKLRYLTTHAFVAPGRHTDPANLDLAPIARVTQLEIWQPTQ